MLDFSFAEIIVIGVVALVVVGPERLPKVARTAGIMFGRLQRYVSNVKADIAREIEMDGLKQLKTDMEDAARSVRAAVTEQAGTLEQAVKQHAGAIEQAVTEQAGAIEQAVTQNVSTLEQAVSEHTGALDQAVSEHTGALEQAVSSPAGEHLSSPETANATAPTHEAQATFNSGSPDAFPAETADDPAGVANSQVHANSSSTARGPFIPAGSDDVTSSRPGPTSSAPVLPVGVANRTGADEATASHPGQTGPGSAPRAPTMPFSWNEQTASVEAAGSELAPDEDNPQQLDLHLEQAKPRTPAPPPKAQSPVTKE
jgi:sec-independent protein translocase protein TatB